MKYYTLLLLITILSLNTMASPDVVPSIPIGIGGTWNKGTGGFHLDIKSGPFFLIDKFTLQPTVGYHFNARSNNCENLLGFGGYGGVLILDFISLQIGGEVLQDSFKPDSRGYRVAAKSGLFHIVTLELAYQNYYTEEIQVLINFDMPMISWI